MVAVVALVALVSTANAIFWCNASFRSLPYACSQFSLQLSVPLVIFKTVPVAVPPVIAYTSGFAGF